MKIFVVIKQVPDTETRIRIRTDGNSIEKDGIKWVINPYDEFAIEEAIKTKESRKSGTVTVLTVGPERCVEALRTAVAMGADEGMHIKGEDLDTYLTAKAIAGVLGRENPDVIFMGKQAIDDDQAAIFHYVAELSNLPSASVIVKVEWASDLKSVKAWRETEGGAIQVLDLPTPCVLAVTKGINTPRYASLPGIMKAKKKELKSFTLSDLGLSSETARVREHSYKLPPERQAGKKITGDTSTQVKELVRLLREEAKVI